MVWARAGGTPKGQRSCHCPRVPGTRDRAGAGSREKAEGMRPLPPATRDPLGRRWWSRDPASLLFLPPPRLWTVPPPAKPSQNQSGGQAVVTVCGGHTATWAHGSPVAKHQALPGSPAKGQGRHIHARSVLGASRATLSPHQSAPEHGDSWGGVGAVTPAQGCRQPRNTCVSPPNPGPTAGWQEGAHLCRPWGARVCRGRARVVLPSDDVG